MIPQVATATASPTQRAQLSQRSRSRTSSPSGSTLHTVEEISGHFPTKVHANAQNRSASRSMEDWAYGLKGQASALVRRPQEPVVGSIRTRLEPINIDKVGGWEWQQVGGKARDVAVGGDGSVWVIGQYDAAGNGAVHPTGIRRRRQMLGRRARRGAGVRIAAGGDGVVWVVNSPEDPGYCATGHTRSIYGRGARTCTRSAASTGLIDIAAGS